MSALVDELAAHTAAAAVRIRLTQALAEMLATIAGRLTAIDPLTTRSGRPTASL